MPRTSKTDTDTADTGQEAHFAIIHGAVGAFYQGQVVTHKDFGVDADGNPNVDLKRLLDLGAIAPVDSRAAAELYDTLGPDAKNPLGDPIVNPNANASQVLTAPGEQTPVAPGADAKAPW